MSIAIRIQQAETSKIREIDFSDLPFGKYFSDHVFIADYRDGAWRDFRIEPFGPLVLSPSAMALHYGQSIFEGLKATKDLSGNPFLFRPSDHARRLNRSAERMCMPALDEEIFLNALQALIHLDRDWIPEMQGSSLYVRPFMFAMDPFLGVRPAEQYRFMVLTGPVGPYYAHPVSLLAETQFVRAVKGGTGEAKAAGNYAASLLPARLAQEKGYDQVIWLEGERFTEIQEAGTMNLVFVLGDKVVTPATDGAILKGITRDSMVQILRDKGITVAERKITIGEVMGAANLKEAFGVGTAAVVVPVKAITHEGRTLNIPLPDEQAIGSLVKKEIEDLRSGIIPDRHAWLVPVVGLPAQHAAASQVPSAVV